MRKAVSGGNFVPGGGEGATTGGGVWEIVATGVGVPEEFTEARLLAEVQLERSSEILISNAASIGPSRVLFLRCCLVTESKLVVLCMLLCLSLLYSVFSGSMVRPVSSIAKKYTCNL